MDNLLLFCGPKAITNLNRHIVLLGQKYRVALPTATKAHKIAATVAATKVVGPESANVIRQLSRSVETDARFYQALQGTQHAVQAFATLDKLSDETERKCWCMISRCRSVEFICSIHYQ